MITDYVQDTSKWEGWQNAYRFGAFYIFPPEPLRGRVNALRQIHDPRSQSYCDAHISLTVPLPGSLHHRHWSEFVRLMNDVKPFTITYGPLKAYPGIPGVVLSIEPFEQLLSLVTTLESASVFADAKTRNYPFSPHMTIAEFITLERTDELLQELREEELVGTFVCGAIAYAVPNEDFHFTERAFVEFTGSHKGNK